MNAIYFNGRPLNIWQKIIFGLASIASLVFMFTFGFLILAIILVIAIILMIPMWWRIRKLKKFVFNQNQQFNNMFNSKSETTAETEGQEKGETIEGSFRKL